MAIALNSLDAALKNTYDNLRRLAEGSPPTQKFNQRKSNANGMKKLLLTSALILAGISAANAQGLIKIFNIATPGLVSTNWGSIGLMTKTANSYYFALLISDTIPTSPNPLQGGWTVAQSGGVDVIGHNSTTVAGGVEGPGSGTGASGFAVDDWAYGTAKYVELFGWLASIGATWADVTNQLPQSPYFLLGPNFGFSNTGYVTASSSGTVPAVSIWSAAGISSGFFIGETPEPSVCALAGLGGLCLVALRRRKM